MIYSAAWWFFSVVVVGVLINLASAYLLPIFDIRLLTKLSYLSHVK